MLILPKNILKDTAGHRTIKLDGCTVIESCIYGQGLTDSAFITDHELIYIISGSLIVDEIRVEAGEAILIKRNSCFEFKKQINPNDGSYQSMLFFLRKEYIRDFIALRLNQQKKVENKTDRNTIKINSTHLMEGFVQSLIPYFSHPLGEQKAIIKLKTFELLYQLTEIDEGLLSFFLNLNEEYKISLPEMMESNFTKRLTIAELATISGRSLSAFKRDFKSQFQTTPARWVKLRRLKLAKQLIENSNRKISDIYLEIGFENYAHFSKAFKREFGISPKQIKA
ncbi:helix-turn-helix transcriptional regulator [Aquimarina sp. U1-2]|uniref:helix-turn-helix domain-containing protein n=1 Tax=Aquimarina sp. U1-2 TaxID=2823141 RepID=UPI001AECCBE9|nr:helix-turn-helix domain-containing protein [Aquimarina sp. U1-2]MBP2831277.1 helix-turn-helix transcriptional regulator [Aquimarina sp. U1-2]